MARQQRRRRRRKRSSQLQRHAERIARRVVALLLVGTVMMMLAAMICLMLIGPPPALGIEALWVYRNQDLVRGLVMAGAGAAIFSGPLLVSRRARPLAIVLWLIFFGVCITLFPDRLLVLQRVMWNYAI